MFYTNSIRQLKIPEGISHSYLCRSPHLILGWLAGWTAGEGVHLALAQLSVEDVTQLILGVAAVGKLFTRALYLMKTSLQCNHIRNS